MNFRIEPVERCVHVIDFAVPFVVFTFAKAGATKIKTKYGKPERVKAFIARYTTLLCTVPPYKG